MVIPVICSIIYWYIHTNKAGKIRIKIILIINEHVKVIVCKYTFLVSQFPSYSVFQVIILLASQKLTQFLVGMFHKLIKYLMLKIIVW